MSKFKSLPILPAVALVVVLAASNLPAHAGVLNIGNGATGNNPLGANAPQDPVLVGTGSDISISVNGSGAVTNQVLLTILIPNDTTDLFGGTNPLGTITAYPDFPTLTPSSSGSSAFTGTGFGLGTGTLTYQGNGFWGEFTGNTGASKLSGFLSNEFNSSLNGSNFSAFDASLGVPALSDVTEWGVYSIAITTGPLTGNGMNGLVDVMIPGGLPQGSVLAALDDNMDSTVWTNSGGVNLVPAPPIGHGLPALLAVGGMLFGFRFWERSQKRCSLGTAIPHAAA
jgi:hypothetical protein